MSLLRYNPAGALATNLRENSRGVTAEQFYAQIEPLKDRREAMLNHSGTGVRSEFNRPERLLIEYEALREKSELGRVFRVANRLHDHLDAVGVIGDPSALIGPAALMRACCEPYHNELPRAARGSKPRTYFSTSGIDNDAVEGLLRRLNQDNVLSELDTHGPKDRYAVIAVDALNNDPEVSANTAMGLRLFANQLAESLGDQHARWAPKLITPVANDTGPVRKLAEEIGCSEVFPSREMMGGPFGIYSAATLLPAAFLGLDCIQFLLGAAAMNDHFAQSAADENMVMQSVAIQNSLASDRGIRDHMLVHWNPAIAGLGTWHQTWNRNSTGTRTSTELQSGTAWTNNLTCDIAITQLIVETVRTDQIEIENGRPQKLSLPDETSCDDAKAERGRKRKKNAAPAIPVIPHRMQAAIENSRESLRQGGYPATELILPSLETHTIGQLLQFWWLSSALAAT